VEWYVVDSVDELRRVHEVRADAKAYLRVATPNIGSDWPLSGKFGAGAGEAREIVLTAAELGADLAGVTFHAGSQCRNPENWRVGIEKARALFDTMERAGLRPRMLDIGGGFPVRHVKPIPSIEVIGEVVNEALKAFALEVQVVAEPGRYLVSDAGYFICRVMGTTTRAGKRWMHWDAGLFGGVIETTEGLKYKIRTDRSGPDTPWHVAGPTCDSVDVILRDEPLPSDLQEGDFIYIRNAGAYTTAYASEFNGFPLPDVRIFESAR
jgi:ornithine decarboxylase